MPADNTPSRPTVRDVALRANVSIATVSRVISGAGVTTPKTTEAVLTAMAELGFRANRAGRELRMGMTSTVGVMLPSLSNPVFAECAEGIQRAARHVGWSVLHVTTSYERSYERQAIDTLLSHRVAGLIVTVADGDDNEALDTLDRERIPYVLAFNQLLREDRSFVTIDNVAAAYRATGALIAAGHRRLSMVAGTFAQSDRSQRRLEGFQAAMYDAGLEPGQVIQLPFEEDDMAYGLLRLLEGPNRPTGFFCSTDMLALRVIKILREAGLEVPRDASVVGFDGIETGRLISPALTTIAQPGRLLGERAIGMLQHQISALRPAPPQSCLLPFELVMRETVGECPPCP